MTDEEKLAERYVNGIPIFAEEGEGFSRTQMQQAYLAGLKAGRPKWHKPSEKLPADCSLVLAFDFEDSEPALFEFVTSNTWEWMPRRIACLSNDQIKYWCEKPKLEEVDK